MYLFKHLYLCCILVEYDIDIFTVNFNIVASIVTDDEEAPAVFRMTVESSGTVTISPRS